MESGSVSRWIAGLHDGDSQAVEEVWNRYFARMVQLARNKLEHAPRRAADEEDVALSAFRSFCEAAQIGRFPQLEDRDDLWRLLFTFTVQKACDTRRHELRLRRGGGKVRGESALQRGPDSDAAVWGQVVGDDPTPEFAVMMAEECGRRLNVLDEELREIVLAKLEGYTNGEIARRCNCALRTVERRLALVRSRWQTELA